VSEYQLLAPCLPDARAEWAHLAGLLPAGVLAAELPGRHAALREPAPTGTSDDARTCAVLAWARSGLMRLTGHPAGPPLAPAAPVMTRTAVLAASITELAAKRGWDIELSPQAVLADRAALNGWRRHGRVSANGSSRLMQVADGWLAVSLSRPADIASLPAVLGRELISDPWSELQAYAASEPASDLAATMQLVGIPAAVLASKPASALLFRQLGEPGIAPGLVLDLSAMWAGPLCADILHKAGWRVLKVEDNRRPDGARSGPPKFYASLHEGIPAVRLDFGSAAGRGELLRLADMAGIIVESSRPRALRTLGLAAEDWLVAAPGRTWISITGYGRDDPQQRVAFGDDAAVAGGLVAYDSEGSPVFCGDAIADPLTGLHAGLAGLAADAIGGGWLIDISMAGVCGDVTRPTAGPVLTHETRKTQRGWTVSHANLAGPVLVS
jgi:crotonobetainyl-CoA:carnitine CoA-transferase CaiB-like acyl-CoA transferase